jgi:hypothetical protein
LKKSITIIKKNEEGILNYGSVPGSCLSPTLKLAMEENDTSSPFSNLHVPTGMARRAVPFIWAHAYDTQCSTGAAPPWSRSTDPIGTVGVLNHPSLFSLKII